MSIFIKRTLFSIGLVFAAAQMAVASPGVDFVCYDSGQILRVGFDITQENAYLDAPEGEVILPNALSDGGDSFDFDNGAYRLMGNANEGELTGPNGIDARCWQTAESIKAIALYGGENNGRWSPYFKQIGTGHGNIRTIPSASGELAGNLGDGEPVVILANTDEFLDGFYWFHIQFGESERGYIWGALLCYDGDEPELQTAIRPCG